MRPLSRLRWHRRHRRVRSRRGLPTPWRRARRPTSSSPPSYTPGTLETLRGRRKDTRILSGPPPEPATRQLRSLGASLLVQDVDRFVTPRGRWRIVTKGQPSEDAVARPRAGLAGLRAHDVQRHRRGHVGQAVGVGAGQQSRVVAAEIAVPQGRRRAKGGAAASDAFFPFPDGLARAGRRRGRRGRPAGGLGQGRRGHRRRRRGRSGHGLHRRAPLPALRRLDDACASCSTARPLPPASRPRWPTGWPSWPPRVSRVGLGTILVGDDGPSERYVAMKHEDSAELGIYSVGEHLPADGHPGRGRPSSLASTTTRRSTPSLCSSRCPRGSTRSRRCSPSSRPRTSTACTRSTWDALCIGAPGQLPCTPAGILELLACLRGPGRGPSRRDHRPRAHDRTTLGKPADAEAPGLQRRRHRGAYRGATTWPRTSAPPTSWSPPPGGPLCSRPTWSNLAPPWWAPGTTCEGQKLIPDVAPGRGRGGRVDHAPARGGGPNDPCHAVAQRLRAAERRPGDVDRFGRPVTPGRLMQVSDREYSERPWGNYTVLDRRRPRPQGEASRGAPRQAAQLSAPLQASRALVHRRGHGDGDPRRHRRAVGARSIHRHPAGGRAPHRERGGDRCRLDRGPARLLLW